jgi:putative ABC transport system permease protein
MTPGVGMPPLVPTASAATGVRLAIRSIRRNVLRAALTVLGILIGVASVVTITALGAGARDSVGGQIQSLGSNFMLVFPQSSAVSGAKGAQGSGFRLTEEDGRVIARDAVSVKAVAPTLRTQAQVVSGENNWSTSVMGTTIPFLEIRNWKIDSGEMWTEHDEVTKAKVCVIGATVRDKLFGTEDPIGRTIRIGRYPYRILGMLEKKGEAPFGGDQDDMVAMPIGSMRSRILKTTPGFAGVLFISATSADTSDRAEEQVDSILRDRHKIEGTRQPDFQIRTQKEFQAIQATVYNALTLLLAMIAAVSLLVGGIGVMNIMLVSVTERTREIGIRMAIGAREADVRTQFLIEAIVLAVIGGLAGALIGILAIFGVGMFVDWPLHVDPVALTVSILVSGLTGVSFGFFPARKAAQLDPIEALRHE